MKKIIFIIVLFFSSFICASQEPTVLKVGIYNNAPKIFIDQNKPTGFFPELLNQIAKQNNWKLHYVECVWEDCLQKLENNQLDIMPDVAYSQSREEKFDFSEEIILSSWSEIYINKKSKINSILDLNNKKIALLKSGIQYEFVTQTITLFNVEPIFIPVDDYKEAFSLLKENKIDGAIVNNFYGRYYAKEYDIVQTDILLSPSALKFAYSKKLPIEIKNAIDSQLKIYKNNPSSVYYQLKEKWLEATLTQILPSWIIYAILIGIVAIIVLGILVGIFKYLVNKKARQIEKQTLENERLAQERAKDYKNVLLTLVKVIEQRDAYTAGHSQRVAQYSKMLALDLNIDIQTADMLYEAGILHDIGKVAIPDVILLKPETLSTREYDLIKEHVGVGINILEEVPRFQNLANIIKYHHEKYDGSGYPYGLKADEIPFLSHIMIVADAFDAMTTNRIYRHKRSINEALNELERLKNIQFHPRVVNSALKIFKNIELEETKKQEPTTRLEKERMVYFYKDTLTHVFNYKYFLSVLNDNIATKKYRFLYVFSCRNFSEFNFTHGWEAGDDILVIFSNTLKEFYHDKIICRLYSDHFVIISEDTIDFHDSFLNTLQQRLGSEIYFTIQSFNLKQKNLHLIHLILKNLKTNTDIIYNSLNNTN